MKVRELLEQLERANRNQEIYVAIQAGTPDEMYMPLERIRLAPRLVFICDEEELIIPN